MKTARTLVVLVCAATSFHAFGQQPIDLTDPAAMRWMPPAPGPGVAGAQSVSARVLTSGTSLQYAALTLDDDGVDNLFIKVQQQDSSGMFSNMGFYHGNNGSGWPGITGGPAFFTLDTAFSEADMLLEHDGAGNVRVTLANLVPSQPDQVHERGGWVPRGGDGRGIAGFASFSRIDDFGDGSSLCDDFNRADGPLGPDWNDVAPGCRISGGQVTCGSRARSNFVAECGGPTCTYTVKKSKAKGGCAVCPPKGGEVSSGVECEDVKRCEKKIKGNVPCPDGGNGICKVKGKRSSCG